jgi:hypothetical protein
MKEGNDRGDLTGGSHINRKNRKQLAIFAFAALGGI